MFALLWRVVDETPFPIDIAAGKVLLHVWSEQSNVWGVVATTDQRLLFVECRPV
jgi:hypothetical protein